MTEKLVFSYTKNVDKLNFCCISMFCVQSFLRITYGNIYKNEIIRLVFSNIL